VRRHPVQLYEVAFLLALAAILLRIPRQPEGRRYRVFLISYLAFRLAIDFLKPAPTFGGLSVIQWTCVAALFWYAREVLSG
jgi:phosphatidylglycerol:prolipoprotein diacylglycerol transferase